MRGCTMKTKEFTLEQLASLVRDDIIPLLKRHTVIALYGPLGIGKTTLVKEVLRQCGVEEPVTSPTFGYVNTYTLSDGESFNHFDLYRLTMLDQFIDAGFDEYISRSKTISFIEWPEIIEPLLEDMLIDKNVARLFLDYDLDDVSRRLIRCDRW